MDGGIGTDVVAHSATPGDDRLIVRQREAAILRSMAVGIDRDIGDREIVSNEKRSIGEATVHCGERTGSGFALCRNHALISLEPSGQGPEAERADDRLDFYCSKKSHCITLAR